MDEEGAAYLAQRWIAVANVKVSPRSDALLLDGLRKIHFSSGVGEDVYPEVSYDGQQILVTAGDRRGFADYQYRRLGPGEPWVHPVLQDWAMHHKCYWRWASDTSIQLCKWANYDYDGDF